MIITYIVGRIATAINISKAYYIMFVIYLVSANQLYIWDVKRKLNKILENNKDMSEEELIDIVRKKGGTSTIAAIIYAVIVVLFIFALMLMASYVSSLSY